MPAKPLGDHNPLELEALLFHAKDALVASDVEPLDWDEPVITGDPVTDRWEREIAAGRTPDLDASGSAP